MTADDLKDKVRQIAKGNRDFRRFVLPGLQNCQVMQYFDREAGDYRNVIFMRFKTVPQEEATDMLTDAEPRAAIRCRDGLKWILEHCGVTTEVGAEALFPGLSEQVIEDVTVHETGRRHHYEHRTSFTLVTPPLRTPSHKADDPLLQEERVKLTGICRAVVQAVQEVQQEHILGDSGPAR